MERLNQGEHNDTFFVISCQMQEHSNKQQQQQQGITAGFENNDALFVTFQSILQKVSELHNEVAKEEKQSKEGTATSETKVEGESKSEDTVGVDTRNMDCGNVHGTLNIFLFFQYTTATKYVWRNH